ncbi:MAG: hypothetical protein QOD99_2499 [Chthoniobacter sp.]|jgi:hypothetical protein|nr:hypothetical protein [Chthoniobacter sp.]
MAAFPNSYMKFLCFLLALFCTMSLQSADILSELKCHDKVVEHGVNALILPKEVEAIFGAKNVDHFISNFGSKSDSPIWNSVAYFNSRYQLTLQVPVAIDYGKCRLVGATSSAIVRINEIVKVGFSKSGIAEAEMKGQWRLNENEWKWLIKNKGDWSAVRVPIRVDAPVAGFDQYVNQLRQPIRDRKNGFDKPVQRAVDRLR